MIEDLAIMNKKTLSDEEKEKYSKEILTNEEIKKLKAMMAKSEDNSVKIEDDFVVETICQ